MLHSVCASERVVKRFCTNKASCVVLSREAEQTSSVCSQKRSESQPAVSPLGAQSQTGSDSGGNRSIAGHQEILRGHEAAVNDVIFSPDGRNTASASADGVVSSRRFADLGIVAARVVHNFQRHKDVLEPLICCCATEAITVQLVKAKS